MGRVDPFTGYSILLRTIIYVLVPAFGVWQFLRLRRALHVFQLEGYKRKRFVDWCRSNGRRALFLRGGTQKKPLVMTGRARRLLITSTILSVLLMLGLSGVAHISAGWPFDVTTWAIVTALAFVFMPLLLVATDVFLTPVQAVVNNGYKRRALATLRHIDPLVVGVTGSFGKTSTKFAIEHLIGPPGEALATPGSFNTPLGIVRAINEGLSPQHRYFIVEMGAYKEGEIAELCALVQPKIGVLTAIGPAHLDRFGSLDAIRRAKYEIVASLPTDGTAVMNVDDPEVRALADRTTHVPVVRYGALADGNPDVTCADNQVTADGTSLTLVDRRAGRSLPVKTRLLGRHSIGHILGATAVALTAGRSLDEIAPAIAELDPVEHRLQLIHGAGGITVIDDAFNSNPEGAAAALEVLDAMPGGRKVVVTPGIIELGELQADANRDFGARAGEVADAVVVVAKVNREAIVSGATGRKARVITVDSLDEATARLPELISSGDVVLFENDLPDQYEG